MAHHLRALRGRGLRSEDGGMINAEHGVLSTRGNKRRWPNARSICDRQGFMTDPRASLALGEPPVIFAGRGIANAVENAIGVERAHLPFTPTCSPGLRRRCCDVESFEYAAPSTLTEAHRGAQRQVGGQPRFSPVAPDLVTLAQTALLTTQAVSSAGRNISERKAFRQQGKTSASAPQRAWRGRRVTKP